MASPITAASAHPGTIPTPKVHPETIPGDPAVVCWVLTDGTPSTGRLVAAPGALGRLLAPGGPIVRAVVERRALWTWLADADWARHGVAVRDAVAAAAGEPEGWRIEDAADEVLELVARDVIERTHGDYIASHGGRIELRSAAAGQVVVRLSGACEGCPAAAFTLQGRIQAEIRDRVADPTPAGPEVSVRAETEAARTGRRRWLARSAGHAR